MVRVSDMRRQVARRRGADVRPLGDRSTESGSCWAGALGERTVYISDRRRPGSSAAPFSCRVRASAEAGGLGKHPKSEPVSCNPSNEAVEDEGSRRLNSTPQGRRDTETQPGAFRHNGCLTNSVRSIFINRFAHSGLVETSVLSSSISPLLCCCTLISDAQTRPKPKTPGYFSCGGNPRWPRSAPSACQRYTLNVSFQTTPGSSKISDARQVRHDARRGVRVSRAATETQ